MSSKERLGKVLGGLSVVAGPNSDIKLFVVFDKEVVEELVPADSPKDAVLVIGVIRLEVFEHLPGIEVFLFTTHLCIEECSRQVEHD